MNPNRLGANPNAVPVERLDLDSVRIDPVCALRLPARVAMQCRVVPLAEFDDSVHLASQVPLDPYVVRMLDRFFERPIRTVLAEPSSLQRALHRIYGDGASRGLPGTGLSELGAGTGSDPDDAKALADDILRAAVLRQASDIHFDPSEREVRVRFRVDGELEEAVRLAASQYGALVNRFKIVSQMNIAERRAPQDGAFRHTLGTGANARIIDVRAATIPTRHGERITLRLLAVDSARFELRQLGMSERHFAVFGEAISKPHGLILLTGPTGSGKTTTLYAAIREQLKVEALNVMTIEDPIENEIPGIVQVEVDAADKVSFSGALRSVLRHDPDVLMIGEIRDAATADVAIKSALTGHMVFSSLHTNSAPGAVVRLCDMGVERYLVASTLRLCVAQRLARRLCPHCRKPRRITPSEALFLLNPALAGETCHDPGGCVRCAGRGFVGRLGIFELLPIDEEWSGKIAGGAGEASLLGAMRERGMPTLIEDAAEKVVSGLICMADVRRALTVW